MWYHLILLLVVPQELNISLFSLSVCTDELILAPKIMTLIPMLSSVNINSERDSNPMM